MNEQETAEQTNLMNPNSIGYIQRAGSVLRAVEIFQYLFTFRALGKNITLLWRK